MYAEFGISDFPGVMVYVDDAFTAWYATAQTNGSLFLGTFSAGDTINVKLTASADLTIEYAAFATENADVLALYHNAVSDGACPLTRLSASHYTGSFSLSDADSLLVMTIPFDEAWTVLLDGARVDAFQTQDCLMAVNAAPGSHTIELRYIPAGLIPGAAISLVALVSLAAAYALTTRSSHTRKGQGDRHSQAGS